ncbi:MAG: Eco47II family restriction endonuclease, partial [Mariprofundaceae bacterium]|nr:Eco47II family restriction endonuclease [Mariprofundaceae bacterium]
LTFDAKVYQNHIQDVIEAEIVRQIDKSNTNHIGFFHQNIFRYIGSNWCVPDAGYDIINADLHYYIEMKNKHNTMNSSSSQKTYMRMQHTLLSDDEATCFLVEVIAKHSQNIKWSLSLDGKPVSHKNIRRISIDQFYTLVTGQHDAFKCLCEQLLVAIDDVIAYEALESKQNTVVEELQHLSPNVLKSLYLLSFHQYEGFDQFDV